MPAKQNTLAGTATFEGVGLHSGSGSRVAVEPAKAGSGLRIAFNGHEQALNPGLADGLRHCSSLSLEGGLAMTVEHLLSALWGMGIDNAVIRLDGPEVPGLDGSALPFAEAFKKAGIVAQDENRRMFSPKAPISVGDAASGITAYPSPNGSFRITYLMEYAESPLARGAASVSVEPEAFFGDVAPARTFVMKQHVEAMLAAGLGKGADAKNTLVLDGDRVIDNAFRLPDECVRHKILDLIGDLALVNRRLCVHVVANRSGHALNLELGKALAKEIDKAENPRGIMDIRSISELLPHRYPFLLVDRVLELEPRKRIVAMKNVTGNEEFFQGHFPGEPIMPGVLQLEALAQTGALMILGDFKGQSKLAVLMSTDDLKWRRQVVPGDQIIMNAVLEKMKSRIGVARAWSTVDGDPTVECVIKFAIVDAKREL